MQWIYFTLSKRRLWLSHSHLC